MFDKLICGERVGNRGFQYKACHLNVCSTKAPKISDNQAKGWKKVREDTAKAVVAN